MKLPENLISYALLFMPQDQIYLIFPFIKKRHELSTQLLGMFEEVNSKMEVVRLVRCYKNHDKYPFDMMYYLRRSHAKNVAKFFSWDDNYYFKIDIKKYPIGSDECMEAIRNSKIKLGEDYYYDDE